jgi:hypothetical protein
MPFPDCYEQGYCIQEYEEIFYQQKIYKDFQGFVQGCPADFIDRIIKIIMIIQPEGNIFYPVCHSVIEPVFVSLCPPIDKQDVVLIDEIVVIKKIREHIFTTRKK